MRRRIKQQYAYPWLTPYVSDYDRAQARRKRWRRVRQILLTPLYLLASSACMIVLWNHTVAPAFHQPRMTPWLFVRLLTLILICGIDAGFVMDWYLRWRERRGA